MLGEILSIGDELTSGQRLDTNTQWLSQRLGDLGVRVIRHGTVADDLPVLTDAVRRAIDRSDFVVMTGGLGPTADDLTRDAIAAALGVPLRRDEASLDVIRAMFTSRGRTMPESNQRQADLPEGARAIPNATGTAPGVAARIDRAARPACWLFALPGVPAEMRPMWTETVAPAILAEQPEPRVIAHRTVKCFGAGESHIEAMLPDLIARGREPLVGITASGATITLRVTASGRDEAEAVALMQPTLATIRQTLGDLVYGEGDDGLQDAVARRLATATLVTEETWTAGLVAHWMADSAYSLTCSSVKPEEEGLADRGQLEARATEIRKASGADWSLVVGAPTESEPVSVGAAVASQDGAVSDAWPLVGGPSILRTRIAKHALNLLRLRLEAIESKQ